MKLTLNGALTIATHDGANDEIAEAVGRENIFMFGHTYEELRALKQNGYDPIAIDAANPELHRTLDMIRGGYFSPADRTLFAPIVDSLLAGGDYFMLLADYEPYVKCQQAVDDAYQDKKQWNRKAILNVAQIGGFFGHLPVPPSGHQGGEAAPDPR